MKKWRGLVMALLVVGLAVGGYFGYGRIQAVRAAATTTSTYQTAAVQSGNLVVSVSAAGTISAQKSVNLVFNAAGRVADVFVKAGDVVTAGQTVMTLDPTDLQASVAKAKLALATAENQLKKTKTASTAADIAAAQAAVKSAEANLAKVKAGPTTADLATAQAAVAVAVQNRNTAASGATADALRDAQLKVDQAKNSLWATQAQRDAGPQTGAAAQSAKASVANAELAVQQAENALAALQEPATAATLSDLNAKVAQAQQALADLKASPTAADVASAEATVLKAQATLADLQAGATSEDVAIAQASVDNARLSLEQAQAQLANATLQAPFAGVVLAVNFDADEWVGSEATAVVVADLDVLEVTASLSEVDVVKASVGNTVTLQFDALTGVSLKGHVELIAPTATIAQGVSNYPVTVVLDDKNAKVRPGMSANLTIITEERQNVLVVPNKAIRTQSGNRVVAVMTDGQLSWTKVTVGASNDTQSEITAGLQAGQTVVTNPPTPPTNAGATQAPGANVLLGGAAGGAPAGAPPAGGPGN